MKTQKNDFRLIGTKTIQNKMKECAILFSVCLLPLGAVYGQSQTYDNFEGKKVINYVSKTGVLDTLAKNPASNSVNSSEKCAKYVRSKVQKFDNIKISLNGKLSDVEKYATYSGTPEKLSMKVYTTAPVGTPIEIQLGKLGKNEFPLGINSQFEAKTKVSNAWEVIEFKFSQTPKGSETSATQLDQITLMFNPNSSTGDTYYFDDLTGPAIATEQTTLKTTPIKSNKTAAVK